MRTLSAPELRDALRSLSGEIALLDVREEGVFARGHILLATSAPLSRLELDIGRLVPRKRTRLILCDDADGLCEKAGVRLSAFGYSNISLLQGGMPAWCGAGYEVFTGLNAPSKALGVFAARELAIPEVLPDELAAMQMAREHFRIVDCRPYPEYQQGTIPGAFNSPGMELLRELAGRKVDTTLVVTCAGRTRGLLSAQTLIDAGVTGKIIALHKGTMGWELSGRSVEKKADRKLQASSMRTEDPKAIAAHIRQRAGITELDADALARWLLDDEHTTYLFDIRTEKEYEAGHISGARHVIGGQLIQNLDMHVATRGAHIIITDDDGVRATGVGLWLRRFGWAKVAIAALNSAKDIKMGGSPAALKPAPPEVRSITSGELHNLIGKGDILVVDLATSRSYRAGHIPGSWFAIRSRLDKTLPKLPTAKTLVLTSEDGRLAAFASMDQLPFDGEILVLQGGNADWRRAGYALQVDLDRLADTPEDVLLKPSELTDEREEAMREYVSGSDDLLDKIARDGSLHLRALPMN